MKREHSTAKKKHNLVVLMHYPWEKLLLYYIINNECILMIISYTISTQMLNAGSRYAVCCQVKLWPR